MALLLVKITFISYIYNQFITSKIDLHFFLNNVIYQFIIN